MKSIYLFFFSFGTYLPTALAQLPDKATPFLLLNVVNNKQVSLMDYASQRAVVLVFTSNYCPYSRLYEDRLISLAQAFENKGVRFLFINSNTSADNADDAAEEMARRADEKHFTFPYLSDKTQKTALLLAITKTPEVVVLEPENGIFKIRYRGAIDNNAQLPDEVTEPYLHTALTAILQHQPLALPEKKAVGCRLKKE